MPDTAPDYNGSLPGIGGSILMTFAFAAALLVAPTIGGLNHGAAPVLGALLVSTLVMSWGRALVPLLRTPARVPRYLTAIILGYTAASIVHLTATALLNIDARHALGLDGILALIVTGVAMRRAAHASAGHVSEDWSPAIEAGIVVACAALATFWARETITAVPHAASTGIFPAWQDYFLHAAEISYLRDYPAFERHSQYLTAVSQPLYHRGSYALPALLSEVSGMPSLGLATTYWLPTGLLLTLCATYVFGTALGGALAGLGAVVAVFLVPDASAYGFENRFLSFHWLMQMAAGSGYALAPVLVGLTLVVTAETNRRARAIVSAGLLIACAAVFRVHVAMLAAGTLAWLVLLAWRPRVTKVGLASALALLTLVAAALKGMESIALAPHFLSGLSHPALFFLSIHSQASNQPTPYIGWTETRGDVWKVVLGYAMMVVAGCGASLVVLLAAWRSRVLAGMGWRVGALPVALLLSNLSVILFVPTPAHGDITDFGHRPFVLVYLVFAAIAGAAVAHLLLRWATRHARAGSESAWSEPGMTSSPGGGAMTSAWCVLVLAALAGLATPWKYGAQVQQRWWPPYAAIPVSREALAAGEFVRVHSRPGEQVLAASQDPEAVYVALTERRAYLSRVSLYQLLGGTFSAQVQARIDAQAAFATANSFEQLRALGTTTGVSWYIADTPPSLRSAAIASRCAYCGDTVRVYDLR